MNDVIREALDQRAHAAEPTALDVNGLVAHGERRLRRRRFGIVAGAALAVALVVAVPALIVDLRDEPRSVEQPKTPIRPKQTEAYSVPFDGWGAAPPPAVANLRAVIELPAGFDHRKRESGVIHVPADGRGVGFWTVSRVNINYCAPTTSQNYDRRFVDPGPSVEGLANVLANQPRLGGNKPVPVTVGGYSGLYVELSWPRGLECEGGVLWLSLDANPNRESGVSYHDDLSPGVVDRFWILDVAGQRVVIDAFHRQKHTPAQIAELTEIVEGVTLTRAD